MSNWPGACLTASKGGCHVLAAVKYLIKFTQKPHLKLLQQNRQQHEQEGKRERRRRSREKKKKEKSRRAEEREAKRKVTGRSRRRMKMLFVVGIEMSKVQSRRHCQFEGGHFGGRGGC